MIIRSISRLLFANGAFSAYHTRVTAIPSVECGWLANGALCSDGAVCCSTDGRCGGPQSCNSNYCQSGPCVQNPPVGASGHCDIFGTPGYISELPLLNLSNRTGSDRPRIDGQIDVTSEYSKFLQMNMYDAGGNVEPKSLLGISYIAYDIENKIVCAAATLLNGLTVAQDSDFWVRFGVSNGEKKLQPVTSSNDASSPIGYEGCWDIKSSEDLNDAAPVLENHVEIKLIASTGKTAQGALVCLKPPSGNNGSNSPSHSTQSPTSIPTVGNIAAPSMSPVRSRDYSSSPSQPSQPTRSPNNMPPIEEDSSPPTSPTSSPTSRLSRFDASAPPTNYDNSLPTKFPTKSPTGSNYDNSSPTKSPTGLRPGTNNPSSSPTRSPLPTRLSFSPTSKPSNSISNGPNSVPCVSRGFHFVNGVCTNAIDTSGLGEPTLRDCCVANFDEYCRFKDICSSTASPASATGSPSHAPTTNQASSPSVMPTSTNPTSLQSSSPATTSPATFIEGNFELVCEQNVIIFDKNETTSTAKRACTVLPSASFSGTIQLSCSRLSSIIGCSTSMQEVSVTINDTAKDFVVTVTAERNRNRRHLQASTKVDSVNVKGTSQGSDITKLSSIPVFVTVSESESTGICYDDWNPRPYKAGEIVTGQDGKNYECDQHYFLYCSWQEFEPGAGAHPDYSVLAWNTLNTICWNPPAPCATPFDPSGSTRYKPDDRVSHGGKNYKCISANWRCFQAGYEPYSSLADEAWVEIEPCDGSSGTKPLSSATKPPVLIDCPEVYDRLARVYVTGDRASYGGVIYECTQSNGRCIQAGYEPWASLGNEAWKTVGSCPGSSWLRRRKV